MKNNLEKLVYKIDWLALTIPDSVDDFEEKNKFGLLELLGYNLADFEEVAGRYFYNAGWSLGGYVNVFYNDKKKDLSKNTTFSRNYIFTGQGCTDLAQKINNDWVTLFKNLIDIGCKITRLDIALDDFQGVLNFEKMESKLKKGHYRSSKKTYNIVKQADVFGEVKGYTIYIGSHSKSSKGCYYARLYDKLAQYKSKAQLPPAEALSTGCWQRYEISYTKKKAMKIVEEIAQNGVTIGQVYNETMSDIVQFLEPDKNNKNKSRWKMSKWWSDFLDGAEKIKLGEPERDADLGRLLEWFSVAVLPSLSLLDEVFQAKNIDFVDFLRSKKVEDFSKKQLRLQHNASFLSKDKLDEYLKKYFKE